MDIRLKTLPFVFEGRTYQLRCNMNVLADVQEANGGRISPLISSERSMKSALMFLAAMLTDYADEQGWTDDAGLPLRFTWRGLGRSLRRDELPVGNIMDLVLDALTPPKSGAQDNDTQPPEESRGN